jgi:glutaredoxin
MRLQPALLLGLALCAATPAMAQYKVVGPDGKITYTDRPGVAPPGAEVQTLRAAAAAPTAANAPLPLALRNVAGRFPVTLYTSADCPPCDSARRLLQQRGIPYAERLISSDDDTAALQRITNGRTVPSLTVGGQALRGFLDTDWHATLDLAGYPKESRLPRGWSAAPATPLVARAPAPDPAQTAPAAPPVATAPDPAPAGGIRF